jgi:hypothetical protein
MTTPKLIPVALSAVRRGDVVSYPYGSRRTIDRAYQVPSDHASVPFEVRVDFSDGSFDQFLDWSFELPLVEQSNAEPVATAATLSALVPVESLRAGDVFLPSIDGDVLTVLAVDPEGEGPGAFQVRSGRGVKAGIRLEARSAVILVRRPALTNPELGRRAAAIEAAAGATLTRLEYPGLPVCASKSGRFVTVRLSGEDAGTVLIDRATGQVQVCESLTDAQAEADVLADLPADGTGQTRTVTVYGLRAGDVVLMDGDRRTVFSVATSGQGGNWSASVTFDGFSVKYTRPDTRFVVEAAR